MFLRNLLNLLLMVVMVVYVCVCVKQLRNAYFYSCEALSSLGMKQLFKIFTQPNAAVSRVNPNHYILHDLCN